MPAPLDGLKVVDMGWIVAGPLSARYLADFGADTIKAETGKRLDPLRNMGPFRDGKPGPNRTVSYHLANAGKRGLAVDAKAPEGLAIIRRLVSQADVVVESFTPGVIDDLGLSYAELSKLNPRLIMVSSGLLGRKGPEGLGMSGTGMTGSAYSGATNLVGWPDRPPEGPVGPWTDAVAPRFTAAAILAAVHRREHTGRGVYIDMAQAEAGLQFLLPAYFDCAINHRAPERAGSAASPLRAPCGAYPAAGADRWVVIDADTPAAWDALRRIIAAPLLQDPRFDTLVGRLRGRDLLDAQIAAWSATRDAQAIEAELQAAGVPAHVVCTSRDLGADTDLDAAGFYQKLEDPEIGEFWMSGPRFTPERTPAPALRPGPRIGADTDAILSGVLGMSAEEIARLREKGVLA
jgi:benzylsuccinate CoA-transferase BbsF subunit